MNKRKMNSIHWTKNYLSFLM